MKNQHFISYSIILFFIWALPVFSQAQNCDPLTRQQLRSKLEELGYTVKDLNVKPGEEKHEVSIKTSSFNVPVAYEISPSTNYIWLTASLGPAKTEMAETNLALLKQNSKIQPCQFYITEKGNLMSGLAVENRGVTNAILRRHTEKIANDVTNTSSVWEK